MHRGAGILGLAALLLLVGCAGEPAGISYIVTGVMGVGCVLMSLADDAVDWWERRRRGGSSK